MLALNEKWKWTIPAGKSIYIISITPEDDHIRQMLRQELKNITITVNYTNAYGSHFKPETRPFDLFARDLSRFDVMLKNPDMFMMMNS